MSSCHIKLGRGLPQPAKRSKLNSKSWLIVPMYIATEDDHGWSRCKYFSLVKKHYNSTFQSNFSVRKIANLALKLGSSYFGGSSYLTFCFRNLECTNIGTATQIFVLWLDPPLVKTLLRMLRLIHSTRKWKACL